ncbi:MAG: type IV pilin N-terminal domain-containing protein [Thermoplasmatota archaeon]
MSKANQSFKQNEEAVSPVIGVILMVAITVVLAAVVFVLVSNLGKGSEAAPSLSFNKDSSARTLTVVKADSGLTWDDFVTGGTCTVTTPSTTAAVAAGDVITVTTATASLPCTFSLNHIATNTLVYTTTFT